MAELNLSIHIFRRDLRLEDNTALLAALHRSVRVLPVFIFDERQLNNPYKGNNSFQFMINSLTELDDELKKRGSKLWIFKGNTHIIVDELIKTTRAEAVFVNRDYTPFSRGRDIEIQKICSANETLFFSYADALLTEPEKALKPDGKPYTVFTPFMKRARLIQVAQPNANQFTNFYNGEAQLSFSINSPSSLIKANNPDLLLKGGRREGLQLLTGIRKLENYSVIRDIPSVNGTSLLSAHHKFGTVSIRETYHALVANFSVDHSMIGELYWRDFFTHIAFHFPIVFGKAFNPKYETLEWRDDQSQFEQWCTGTTGFPIVDAGMRELITTGYMHNRVRMVVASFLTKDLHIDWQMGERFFANHLIDYDPAVNNGNWQWSASTGCDAQPWFRIFNPWSQQHRFDPDCIYIKKWVPELRSLSAKDIHERYKTVIHRTSYPPPMVNHHYESQVAKEMFSRLK